MSRAEHTVNHLHLLPLRLSGYGISFFFPPLTLENDGRKKGFAGKLFLFFKWSEESGRLKPLIAEFDREGERTLEHVSQHVLKPTRAWRL